MKNYLLKIICFLLMNSAMAQSEFITTWKTDNIGTSNDNQITIPTEGIGYNYSVDWGDGNTDNNVAGDITHTYASAGTYSVSITGDFPRIYFNSFFTLLADAEKIMSIEQWGDIVWTSMEHAFSGCKNLVINASDAPNLSGAISTKFMLGKAEALNSDLNNWDVSTITDMSAMFTGTSIFNGDISDWDVSSVENFASMFSATDNFNNDIRNWDVSSGKNFNAMFSSADAFNVNLNNWDMSQATNIGAMFANADLFNQPLNNWNVGNVTNMIQTFLGTQAFNQPLGNWDVSKVNNMKGMFQSAAVFNQSLNNWDVSNVITMESVFEGAREFNADISDWNLIKVTNTKRMFIFADDFNQDLSNWNVSTVVLMDDMFNRAISFNSDISNWDVAAVTSMSGMFFRATSFDKNLSKWNVSQVADMGEMFDESGLSTTSYDNTLTGWAAQTLQNGVALGAADAAYCNGAAARAILTDAPNNWIITDAGQECLPFITTWVTDDGTITIPTTTGTYNYDVVWTNLTNPGTSEGTTSGETGDYTLTGLENNSTYQVEISGDFPRIYINDASQKNKILTIEQWGNIEWTSMESAFFRCINLTLNATDAPNLSNVTSIRRMFLLSPLFDGEIGHWDVSNIENMEGALAGTPFNQDISEWDVSNVTNMKFLFDAAPDFNQDISGWDVSAATDMSYMFRNCTAFNQDISLWEVGNALDMTQMFRSAINFNYDIGSWDVAKVTTMNSMFLNATGFNQDLSNWNIEMVTDMTSMFDNSGLSTLNYDKILQAWVAQAPQPLTFGAAGVQYCLGLTARTTLDDTYGWTITDGGENCIVNIPDANFKTALLANASINTTDDGEITYTEAEAFTGTIDVSNLSISDLTGIEAFTEITQLKANSNTLTEVDVSNNTKLEVLWIRNNALSAIDVSNNIQLTQLFLNGNEMTEIDLTSNVLMDELSLFDNNLSTIDISTLVDLTELSIRGNQLSSIDVSSNVNLLKLYIHSNSITTVDLSNNTLLTDLFCDNNSIASLDFTNNPSLRVLRTNNNELVSLDLSSNTAITQLTVDNNQLAELNIANGNNSNFTLFEASNNGSLSCITVDDLVYAEANFTNVDAGANFSTDCSNTANDITVFSFTEQSSAATIGSGVIDIEVTVGTDLSSLTPTFSLSTGATVDPASGVAQDFSSTFIYTVTAENPTATQEWAVTVIEENVAPSDIALDNSDIAENNANGAVIGVLSTTDGNVADTHSYTLVAGAGDADNAAFTISGNELKAGESFDFETQSTYSMRIQANDGNGGTFEKAFTINVNNLENAAQSISFDELPSSTFGDGPFDLVASVTSGLPLTFESSNEEVASISGSTVTIVGAGTTEITATQSGNVDYASADAIIKTLTVEKATQEISFALVESLAYGAESLELQASSSSELAVSYTSADESIATINGNILNVVGIGTVTITASQIGNTNYLATEQSRELIVSPAQLNISADEVSRSYGEANPALSYSITGLVYQEDESILTTVPTITTEANEASDVGEYAITISGAEATNYAISYSNSVLVIEKANQEITIESISDKDLEAADFEVVASTTSELELVYTILSGPATISGNLISLTGEVGTVEIEVSQAGNENYNAASATISFDVLDDPCVGFAATAAVLQNASCNGEVDGSFEVSTSNGTAPFTFSISNESQDNGLFENRSAGSYEVTVIDANACSATTTVEITEPEAIEVTAETTDSNSILGNGTISLTVVGGTGNYTYDWSNGAAAASLTDLEIGEYSVIITDEAGCSITESYTIGGVTANSEAFELNIYPNPVINHVEIVHGEKVNQITLIDANGKIISQQKTEGEQTQLQMKALPAGMYFIRLDDGKMKRIIKQ